MGLRPIRTGSQDSAELALYAAELDAAEPPLPQLGSPPFAAPGFFSTFYGMMVDVYAVSVGPEKHAFHIALWLAVFNQVGALGLSVTLAAVLPCATPLIVADTPLTGTMRP